MPVTKPTPQEIAALPHLLRACKFALTELQQMTTEEFARGGDQAVRELCIAALVEAGADAKLEGA